MMVLCRGNTRFLSGNCRDARGQFPKALILLVGVAGFEPATPSSRTRCATRLRYTPIFARGAYIASRPRRPQAQGALIGPALVAIVRPRLRALRWGAAKR